MGKIVLNLTNNEEYWPESLETHEDAIIMRFFITDIDVSQKRCLKWIDWLNASNYEFTSSNATHLIKKCTDLIELSDVLYDDGPVVMIQKDTLIDLIHQWSHLISTKPRKIIIKVDNDITMQGVE